jgi:hypothetical protein
MLSFAVQEYTDAVHRRSSALQLRCGRLMQGAVVAAIRPWVMAARCHIMVQGDDFQSLVVYTCVFCSILAMLPVGAKPILFELLF